VGVGADERESLTAAARLLDAKMREIRGSNRMAAVDRIAVLAALNLAHELQQLRDDHARQAVALQQSSSAAIRVCIGSGARISYCKAGAFVGPRVTGLRDLLPAAAVLMTAEAMSLAWGRGKTLLVRNRCPYVSLAALLLTSRRKRPCEMLAKPR